MSSIATTFSDNELVALMGDEVLGERSERGVFDDEVEVEVEDLVGDIVGIENGSVVSAALSGSCSCAALRWVRSNSRAWKTVVCSVRRPGENGRRRGISVCFS